jgi:Protein of unknown function (DUF2971).
MLNTKSFFLCDPQSWDDKNDSAFLAEYKSKKQLKTLLAACVTSADQTYHHWRIFTHGASGACIHFHNDQFFDWVARTNGITCGEINYKTLNELKSKTPTINQLPFTKRKAYEHEDEYRILFESKTEDFKIKNFEFNINMIKRILINPWLPYETFKSIQQIISYIPDCKNIKIERATIVKNSEWIDIAKKVKT